MTDRTVWQRSTGAQLSQRKGVMPNAL